MDNKQDKGFTLVELLIVIVILGILATVTVFAVRGITDRGQENACDVEQRTLETAIEAFYAQYQRDARRLPATLIALLARTHAGRRTLPSNVTTAPATMPTSVDFNAAPPCGRRRLRRRTVIGDCDRLRLIRR